MQLTVVYVYLLLLDKCAFFLVSNSDVGAQIYELVANSKDEKNKFVLAQLLDVFLASFSMTCLFNIVKIL